MLALTEKENITTHVSNSLDKSRAYQQTPEFKASQKKHKTIEVVCGNCGCHVNKDSISIHKNICYCQVYNMETKPDFEEWLINHDYNTLVYEYTCLL